MPHQHSTAANRQHLQLTLWLASRRPLTGTPPAASLHLATCSACTQSLIVAHAHKLIQFPWQTRFEPSHQATKTASQTTSKSVQWAPFRLLNEWILRLCIASIRSRSRSRSRSPNLNFLLESAHGTCQSHTHTHWQNKFCTRRWTHTDSNHFRLQVHKSNHSMPPATLRSSSPTSVWSAKQIVLTHFPSASRLGTSGCGCGCECGTRYTAKHAVSRVTSKCPFYNTTITLIDDRITVYR